MKACRARRAFLALAALAAIGLAPQLDASALARSALSPRHTGMEPPGGPKQLDVLPGRGPSRTPSGGMGYVDAYGNTMYDRQPEEKKPRKRPGPGAYGGYGRKEGQAALPEPEKPSTPLWSFQ